MSLEPDHHGRGRHGNEHRTADTAYDSEEGQFVIAVRQPGHDACESLHRETEHQSLLHADARGEHATWDVGKSVADDVERDEKAQRPESDPELGADERERRGDVEPVQREGKDPQTDDGEHAPAIGALPNASGRGHDGSLVGGPAGSAGVEVKWMRAAWPQGHSRQ